MHETVKQPEGIKVSVKFPSEPDTSPINILACAHKVLELEKRGLEVLIQSLGDSFVCTVETVLSLQGHLIFAGMGKSGQIAKKVCSTFASTGTPSFFIHPAEASHGDLGMIGGKDLVFMFSNSGETQELSDLILHCRRSHIPFIAITQKPKSTLGRSATICLPLPRAEEACPNNLAPTTSALMALALGDALAMTVMKCKGFSAQDFRFLHPGGQLGRRLMKVKDLMHIGEEIPLVSSTVLMAEALILMTQKSLGCLGVIENDRLIGMITDGDLRRHMNSNLTQKTVREIMTPNPLTMQTDALVVDAAAFMNDKKITAVFIVDSAEKPQGILHIHDCLRAGFL